MQAREKSAEKLRGWRKNVSRCRICVIGEDGMPGAAAEDASPVKSLIHCERRPKRAGYRDGWARPMLDKGVDPPPEVVERSLRSGVLIVAEAPNRDDTFDKKKGYITFNLPDKDSGADDTAIPTRALLASVGLEVDDVVFTNSVQCLPKGEDGKYPVSDAIKKRCYPHLERLVGAVRPRVVIGFGNAALRALFEIEPFRRNDRVIPRADVAIGKLLGSPIPWLGTVVVPLYHPGRLGQVNRPHERQLEDFRVVGRVLHGLTSTAPSETIGEPISSGLVRNR